MKFISPALFPGFPLPEELADTVVLERNPSEDTLPGLLPCT